MSIEHAHMVAATVKSGQEIADKMDSFMAHILHMGVGVSDEAGELLGAIKKAWIYNKPLDVKHLVE